MVTVNGKPLRNDPMPLNCQSPAIPWTTAGAFPSQRRQRPNGSSQDPDGESLCRTSKVDLPR
jgi:hypothetical protein